MNPAMVVSALAAAAAPARPAARPRGGGGQDDRRGHPEGALDHDVPGRPEPADGQGHAEDLDPLTVPDEREEHREQQERQLDDQAPGHEGGRDPADAGQPHQRQGVQPKAQNASRGVATTARTNSRLAAILHWGRARCSGLVPGR
jgi:hypothetical protein